MLKSLQAIHSVVQGVAKLVAFIVACVFTFIAWLIFKLIQLVTFVLTVIMMVPAKIAQYSFMFAMDISVAENRKIVQELDEKIRAKIEAEEQRMKGPEEYFQKIVDEETDFQRGQEDMREKAIEAIALWFERDRQLPAHAATAQTIQELVRTIPAVLVAEKVKNDPS